jgi:hypothetical protein|tara:strand:+ start:80 stop:508 length:429 start_codon:yes stop_codon:yes gene_type:complete
MATTGTERKQQSTQRSLGLDMTPKPNRDNSPKACIHLTAAEKIAALEACGVDCSGPIKGAAPAILRALPKWAREHPDGAAALAVFVASERPATMSAGEKLATQAERLVKSEGRKALGDLAHKLDPKHRAALVAELLALDDDG